MRTGDFKETYGELVTLPTAAGVAWVAALVAALIVAPFW